MTSILAAVAVAVALAFGPGAAAARDPFVAAVSEARTAQQHLGYAPCDPAIVPFEKYGPMPEAWAWAAWPETFAVCEVAFSPAMPLSELDRIAWHEVCHLSTGVAIDSDPTSQHLTDHYHSHPAFVRCMDRLPPGPLEPDADPAADSLATEPQHLPDGTLIDPNDPESDEEYHARLCLQLQEAKPWIDWGCGN